MKTTIALLLSTALLAPMTASAHPWGPGPGGPHGGWGHGRGWGPGPGWHRAPGRGIPILPGIATAILVGGLTYYLLNDTYYQRQGDTYYVVQPPAQQVSSYSDQPMRALDYNGQRFYVQDGHYYRRDINGQYLEVPRPPGL